MKCASIGCRRDARAESNFCEDHRPEVAAATTEETPFDLRYWIVIWGMRTLLAGVVLSIATACGSVGALAIVGAAYVLGHPL